MLDPCTTVNDIKLMLLELQETLLEGLDNECDIRNLQMLCNFKSDKKENLDKQKVIEENADLQRQIVLLQHQLEEKDRRVKVLENLLKKPENPKTGLLDTHCWSQVNSATQTDRSFRHFNIRVQNDNKRPVTRLQENAAATRSRSAHSIRSSRSTTRPTHSPAQDIPNMQTPEDHLESPNILKFPYSPAISISSQTQQGERRLLTPKCDRKFQSQGLASSENSPCQSSPRPGARILRPGRSESPAPLPSSRCGWLYSQQFNNKENTRGRQRNCVQDFLLRTYRPTIL